MRCLSFVVSVYSLSTEIFLRITTLRLMIRYDFFLYVYVMSGYVRTCLWHPATTGLTQQIVCVLHSPQQRRILWHGWKTMMENWNAGTNWGRSTLTYSHAALPTSTTFKTLQSIGDPGQERILRFRMIAWVLLFGHNGSSVLSPPVNVESSRCCTCAFSKRVWKETRWLTF